MSVPAPVRVLIVDDQPAIRLGVASLIEAEHPALSNAGAAATADEALRLARLAQPDVVLLDVDLDGDDGLALIPSLQACAPCRIVVLTSAPGTGVRERALTLGAVALVRKDQPAQVLIDEVHQAASQPVQTRPAAVGSGTSRSRQDE